MAERLIVLAASAIFLVMPLSVLVTGVGSPGAYGAAMAIALVFVAIPVLALAWIGIAPAPWRAVPFAVGVWVALTGTLAWISPVLALTCGAIIYFVAGGNGTAARLGKIWEMSDGGSPSASTTGSLTPGVTTITVGVDGAIRFSDGARAAQFKAGRPFIEHVHLAERIIVLSAIADAAHGVRDDQEISARLTMDEAGQPHTFERATLAIRRIGCGILITVSLKDGQDVRVEEDIIARQRFIATVSHELRTPLNSIIGFSDILRRDLFGALANRRQREYVDLIHSSGNHLLSVVNTILDVSKLNAGTYTIHRESFDLSRTIEDCVSMLTPQAGQRHVTVAANVAPEISEADADRRAVKQIIINLLSNAIKFSAEGGHVSIDAERRERGFQICVTDSGIGMSEDEIGRIGSPFAQVNNAYTRTCEGTGLGLAIVKGLTALHEGDLRFESAPEKGTKVTVYIPDRAISFAGKVRNVESGGSEKRGQYPAGQGEEQSGKQEHAVRLAG
ncbi:sensor histidine kinase [Oricola cellulosilytica]|uniref:histidine kinase n=1 Tax=Oricola cellulosilytica TaxID=1429082 RepID=A0A4R0PA22_9HYPH|nr:HAMP domain-containing sensor histidine kinase [Oricola cellulosilytica]TCD14101.1 HAMP domain-containing histidine kinase [Oricola cellulosilytica]